MSRKKMMIPEYIVCLFTFVAIQYVGIEVGMLMGILGAMANFVYSYAKKSNVTVTALRFSNAVRTFEVCAREVHCGVFLCVVFCLLID